MSCDFTMAELNIYMHGLYIAITFSHCNKTVNFIIKKSLLRMTYLKFPLLVILQGNSWNPQSFARLVLQNDGGRNWQSDTFFTDDLCVTFLTDDLCVTFFTGDLCVTFCIDCLCVLLKVKW